MVTKLYGTHNTEGNGAHKDIINIRKLLLKVVVKDIGTSGGAQGARWTVANYQVN